MAATIRVPQEGQPMTSTASTTAAPREWRLAARPTRWPTPEDFELATSVLPELAEGQIRVRNEVLSVDPYMRGRMSAATSYAAPYVVGEAMTGAAVGVVEQSRAELFKPGDHVLHGLGWREVAIIDAREARVVDVQAAPASAYLGALGVTGLTAYAGLTRIALLREGDVVFIPGAAGAVGGAAGQIAQAPGASRGDRQCRLAREGSPPHRRPRLRRGVLLPGPPRRRDPVRGHPRRASRCTSTTSAATTSRPPSGRCGSAGGSPSAG
jgi:hypothetical protein